MPMVAGRLRQAMEGVDERRIRSASAVFRQGAVDIAISEILREILPMGNQPLGGSEAVLAGSGAVRNEFAIGIFGATKELA